MATEQHKHYEDMRYVLKKEKKNPNPWTANRQQAMLDRANKMDKTGKCARELAKEFKLNGPR